jgi:hypothetical protein
LALAKESGVDAGEAVKLGNLDMQEDEQRQHTNLHCKKNGLASAAGWTVREYWYDVNMELIAEFKTTPDMCS